MGDVDHYSHATRLEILEGKVDATFHPPRHLLLPPTHSLVQARWTTPPSGRRSSAMPGQTLRRRCVLGAPPSPVHRSTGTVVSYNLASASRSGGVAAAELQGQANHSSARSLACLAHLRMYRYRCTDRCVIVYPTPSHQLAVPLAYRPWPWLTSGPARAVYIPQLSTREGGAVPAHCSVQWLVECARAGPRCDPAHCVHAAQCELAVSGLGVEGGI